MSTIARTAYTAGTTITAAAINANENTIFNDYNGGITNVNISASAAIAATKLNLTAIAQTIAMSSAINFSKGSDITSVGGAPDIGAATGNFVDVTGTTTITSFGTIQSGTVRYVRFTGALILTHNATSLILPTAANITTAAGDVGVFASLGSGNWVCLVFQRKSGSSVGDSSIGGSWRGLSVSRTNATTVAVTATELSVYSAALSSTKITSVSVSPAITASGANGLDTGAETANTIYYVWVIRKSTDGTVAGLLSTASTIGTITFPSGYDQAALVSAVGNDNSSNFINFTQTGKKYCFTSWAMMATANTDSVNWTTIDMTPAQMSTNAGFVPPALSNFCFGSFGGANDSIMMSNDSGAARAAITANVIYESYTGSIGGHWEFDIITADTLYWAAGITTSKVFLHGFELNKLA